MSLTKTERKIRIRTAKRVKYIEEQKVPQTPIIKKFVDFWLGIEKRLRYK